MNYNLTSKNNISHWDWMFVWGICLVIPKKTILAELHTSHPTLLILMCSSLQLTSTLSKLSISEYMKCSLNYTHGHGLMLSGGGYILILQDHSLVLCLWLLLTLTPNGWKCFSWRALPLPRPRGILLQLMITLSVGKW